MRLRLVPLIVGAAIIAITAYVVMRWQRPVAEGVDDQLIKRDFLAMGTLVSITAYVDPEMPRPQAEAAVTAAQNALAEFEKTWAPWGGGELGQINRDLAAGRMAIVPAAMLDLFALAEQQRVRSRGVFDARIGALVKVWGFDDEAHFRKEPPAADAVRDATRAMDAAPTAPAACPPKQRDVPAGALCYGPAPGVAWDFGAIAKGYVVDRVVDQLKSAGVNNVIVNAGGNLRATGRHGDRPWRIGIRHPRPTTPDQVLASLDTLGDEAIITSGDYERFFEHEGRRYHHILTPRTGAPAEGLQAVTVVMTDAALADAASTALFVAGPQRWRDASILLNVSQLLFVDAAGRITVTRALARRLEFPPDTDYRVVE